MTLSEVVWGCLLILQMKCKATLRRCLVREDNMQGWKNIARLLNCLDSLCTLAWKLSDPRLSLSCGFGEIPFQASSSLPMFSLQSPGTSSAQGGDARRHISSWPSSCALWKSGEQGLLSECNWEAPPPLSLFPSPVGLLWSGAPGGQLFCSTHH